MSGILGLAIDLAVIESVAKTTKKLKSNNNDGYESLLGDHK